MTDIMSKVDQYILDILTDVSRQFGGRRISATTDATARAALQSAIEALQGENERLTNEMAAGAQNMRWMMNSHNNNYDTLTAERDALQAKLDAAPKALEPLTDEQIHDLSVAFRGGADWSEEDFDTAELFARVIEAAHGITKGTP